MNPTLQQTNRAPRTAVRRSRSSAVRVLATAAPVAPAQADAIADRSGLKHLSEAARTRATDKKANKFEKVKVEKCGSTAWTDVFELSQKLKDGNTKWEDLNLDDIDIRLKWAGLFHRGKRTPLKFMMRLKVPNGELNARQLRFLASSIAPYGADGCADITTRANIQLRGVTLLEADTIIRGLWDVGLTAFQSGMDSVRNLTGNPIAGIDPHELVDTLPLLRDMEAMLFDNGKGREEFANLPRKLNICISSTRDDFPHTHINDVGFEAVRHPDSGEVVFNVLAGGYFSIKRNVTSISLPCSVTEQQLLPFTEALLRVFRDHGSRGDRQQTRLMWLIEAVGPEKFCALVAEYMGNGTVLAPAVHVHHDQPWERRNLLGVHPQKQAGLNWVGACVPAGRLQAADFDDIAAVAEQYGDGTVRITCEENVLFVNVPDAKLPQMLADPLFKRFTASPGPLLSGMVSCTALELKRARTVCSGNQFCGFGLAETKARAVKVVEMLEAQLDIPRAVRIHFTGCPNSCGQAQVGDIGLMGAPAKLDGKAVEGYKIFLGGKIGENPELAKEFAQGIPAVESVLVPKLKEILIKEFGAKEKVIA
ncbi:Ferredoxin--nitrite reductase, chloroplastic [Tetrabaena socialis]|uniref:Ferredoxin--nitrite reductase, chloroplastic n=1 Tax=Tetrabaena socialis TaxID=47790 RepID=A0A2J8AE68_9CHLO|nr:Ferredoxin--nitrite reductase, chloroplastic [Tetrabaena socialis]|eukprot:PNH10821.1 Ferredoxin--nitrite reductase, chloroplastic [Tetrabaena socialis]